METDLPVEQLVSAGDMKINGDGTYSVTFNADTTATGTASNVTFILVPNVKIKDGQTPSQMYSNNMMQDAAQWTSVLSEAKIPGEVVKVWMSGGDANWTDGKITITHESKPGAPNTIGKLDFSTILSAVTGMYDASGNEITSATTSLDFCAFFYNESPKGMAMANGSMQAEETGVAKLEATGIELVYDFEAADWLTTFEDTWTLNESASTLTAAIKNTGTGEAKDLNFGSTDEWGGDGIPYLVDNQAGEGRPSTLGSANSMSISIDTTSYPAEGAVPDVGMFFIPIQYTGGSNLTDTVKVPVLIRKNITPPTVEDIVFNIVLNEDGSYQSTPTASLKITNTNGISLNLGGAEWVEPEIGGQAVEDITLHDDDMNFDAPVIGGNATYTTQTTISPPAGLSEGNYQAHVKLELSGDETFYLLVNVTINVTKDTPAETYTVTYDPNGGSGVPTDDTEYAADDAVTVKFDTTPTREGYTFLGWSMNDSATTADYTADGTKTFNITNNTTLYAVWEAIQYNVTVNVLKDGQAYTNFDKKIYLSQFPMIYPSNGVSPMNGSVTITKMEPGEYSVQIAGTGSERVDTGVTVKVTNTDETVTVNYYTISFELQGGTAGTPTGTDPQIVLSGKDATKPSDPSRANHTFLGWKTEATGGEDFTFANITKKATAYAQWSQDTYTVKYEKGTAGGVAVDADVTLPSGNPYTVNVGQTHTVLGLTGAPTGYTFKGWHDGTNDVAVGGLVGSGAKKDATITLTAQWEINKYTVTFDSQGGTPVNQITDVAYNTTITAPTAPTKVGYTFDKWYKEDACTTEWDFTSDKVTGDITLYANWNEVTYTINYDPNGGTPTTQSKTAKIGETFTAPTEPTKTGYDFAGWWTETTSGTQFTDTTVTLSADNIPTLFGDAITKTVYAHWEGATYTISGTIMKNGTAWGNAPVTYTINGGTSATATANGSGAYTISNVPYNATVVIRVAGTYLADGTDWSSTLSNVQADNTSADYSFYDLTVAAGTGGSIKTGPTTAKTYVAGAQVTVEATASDGYKFKDWTKPSGPAVTMPTAAEGTAVTLPTTGNDAVVLQANFERKKGQATVTIKKVPVGGSESVYTDFSGDIYLKPADTSLATIGPLTPTNGVATSNDTYQTIAYSVYVGDPASDGVDTGADVTIANGEDGTQTGSAEVKYYEIAVAVTNADSGYVAVSDASSPTVGTNISGSAYILQGQSAYINTRASSANWTWSQWTKNSVQVSTTQTYTVSNVAEAQSFSAVYGRAAFSQVVTVYINGTATQNLTVTPTSSTTGATVPAAQTTDVNGQVTFTGLTPEAVYTLTVSDGANHVYIGTETVTMPASSVLTDPANKDIKFRVLKLTTNTQSETGNTVQINAGTADVNAEARVLEGGTVKITATPSTAAPFYRFDKWTTEETGHAANNNTNKVIDSVSVPAGSADLVITANFVRQYKVTVTMDDAKYATITSPTTAAGSTSKYAMVDEGKRVQAAVTAEPGYRFQTWELPTNGAGMEIYDAEIGGNKLDTTTTGSTTTWGSDDDTSMWVAPTADVTVKAKFVSDVFFPVIEVKYDGNYFDAKTVQIRDKSGKVVASLASVHDAVAITKTGTGQYKVGGNGIGADSKTEEAKRATYDVYVNGYKTGKTVMYKDEDSAKAVVTLYKVTVMAYDVSNTAEKQGGKVQVTGGAYNASEAAELYAPASEGTGESANRAINLAATPNNGYRLATASDAPKGIWTDGKGSGTVISEKNGPYTIASLTEDVTYYANLYQTFTVTVATSAGGTVAVTDPSGVTGTPLNATVDKGEKVTAEAKVGSGYVTDGTGTKDAAFVQWAITAPDATTDSGSFGSSGSSNATATTASADYYPAKNSTIQAQFKTLEVSATDTTTNTGKDVTYTDGTGFTWGGKNTIKAGYTADDHTVTLTLTNVGLITTNNLSASIASGAAGTDIDSTGTNAFEVAGIAADTTLAKDATVDVTIKIKGGLDVKTYTGSLIVKDGDGENDLQVTIPLKLMVKDPATYVPKLETYVDVAQGDVDDETPSSTGVLSVVGVVTSGSSTNGKRFQFKKDSPDGLWVLDSTFHITDEPKWDDVLTIYVNGYNTTKTVTNTVVVTSEPAKVGDLWTVKWSAEKYEDSTNGNATMGTPYFTTQSALTGGTINVPNYNILPAGVTAASAGVAQTDGASLAIPSGAGNTINIKGMPHDSASPYYRFDTWGSYTDKATLGSAATTSDNTVRDFKAATELTPTYKLQYLVTFKGAVDMADTPKTVALQTNPTFTVGSTDTTMMADKSVKVDKDGTVDISNLAVNAANKFSHWKVEADVAGSWGGGTNHAENASGTFTPAADTELTAVVWTLPTLTDVDTDYDKGAATSASNKVPEYTWVLNDATVKTTVVEYKKQAESDWAELATSNYEVSGTSYKLKDTFLKTLENGTYNIRFNSELKDVADTKFNGGDTTLESTFTISATANAITEAKIGVRKASGDTDRPTTANASATDGHEYVEYDPKLLPETALVEDTDWTWYYADKANVPTKQAYTGSFTGTNVTKIAAGTGMQDGVPYAKTTTDMAGKYVFAVVTGKANSTVSSTGYYVTNSVPVDYDVKVKVTVDETDVDDAGKDAFKVTLKPAIGSSVEATFTDGAYTAHLTGDVEYTVVVNTVQGAVTDGYEATTTDKTFTPASHAEVTLPFFTVNRKDFTVENAEASDVSSGTDKGVGESLSANAEKIASVATAGNTDVANGMGVYTGTKVTAKATGWTNDYKLDWRLRASENDVTLADADKVSGFTGKGSDDAKDTGLTGQTIDAKTYIGGELKQNTYKISLGIKDVSNPTWTADEKPAVATAELTLGKGGKIYTFTGTVEGDDPNKGIGGKTVTFEVPYNTDGYTLGKTNITVQDGKTNTNYTETVLVAQPGLVKVAVGGTVTTDGAQKTIDILGATYVLPPFDISSQDYEEETILLPYGYKTEIGSSDPSVENAKAHTVIFKNNGSGTMTEVHFAIPADFEKYFELDADGSKVTQGSGTQKDFKWYDDTDETSKAGSSYTLEPKDTITIVYKVKPNLHVEVREFVLTPEGKRGNGGDLELSDYTHTIKLTVEATTLNSLEIDKQDNTGAAVSTTAVGDVLAVETYSTTPNNIPVLVESGGHLSGVKTDMELTDRSSTTGDLSYQWYAVPNSETQPTAVAGLQDGWKIASATASTYTVTDAEHGKTLYLLMTGAEDATGTVLSQGIKVAYDAWITLQDGSDGNVALGDDQTNYKVAISTSDSSATTGAVTVKWNDTDKRYETEGGALVPGTTYYLWVNTLEGNGTMQKIGKLGETLDTTDNVVKETVTYYQVKYAEDVVVENVYDIADANITDDMLLETGHNKKIDSIVVKGTALSPTKISNAPAHVVKGTVVQFNTTAWTDKDYIRDWYEGTTNKNNNETDNSKAYEVTYNANKEEVKAQLDLNLYTVTVHVKGTGALTEITMTDGKGNVYATNATSGHILATTSAISTVSGDVVLKLPYGGTGAYTVGSAVPSGTKYKNSTDGTSSDTAGIQYPYNSATEYNDKVSDTASQVITMSKTETNELAIWLDGVSWTLKVASAGVDTSDTEHTGDSLTVTAEDANPDKDTTYVAKVSRKYGWTPAAAADDEIEVTVTSAGKSDLHNVTLDSSSLTGPFELDVTSTAFDSDATPDMAAAADGSNHSVTVKLKLKNTNDDNTPLDAGNYTATLSFTYMTKEDGTLLEKKLFYKLKFTVEQDALDTVATEQDNTSVAKNATLTYKENALKTAGLSAQPDELQYLWYSMPVGTLYTVSGSDATTTLAGTGVKLLNTDKMDYDAVNGAAPTVQTADDELGKEIRLLIRPKDATVSFTGYAVSAPIYVQFPGVVEFFKDGSADKETSAPGYEVFFVNGSEVLEGTWSDSAQGYNNDTLDATKTYTAYVSNWPRADVDTTSFDTNKDNFTAVSTTIAGTTLTGNAPTNVAKAEIFTVTLEKPTKANHYQDVEAWGETFDAYPDLTATVADHELAKTSEADKNVSTILKGQTVTVTATTWTQDYELQWMSKTGTATDYTKGNKDASGSATEDYTINAKTDISGEMEQKTYTITGNVKDSTGADSTHLASATLTFTKDTTTVVLTTDSAQADATHFADGNGVNNSTVTFVAPKGQFNLTGVAASGYAVLDVDANTTETEPTTPGVDNVDLTIAVDQSDAAMFQFFVDAISGGIKVYDDAEEPNTVDVTAAGQADVTAKNTYAVNYGYKANKKTETTNDDTKDAYTVTFENTGNTDLTVNYQLKKDGTALDSITNAEKLTIENILGGGVDTTSGKGSFTVKASGNADAKKNVFTFTVPNGLHNTDDVDYTVEFTTTINGATYKAIYELDFDVEPLTVEEVASELTTESGTTYAQLKDADIANIKLSDPEGGGAAVAADGINSDGTTGELEKDDGTKNNLSFQWFSVPTGTTGTAVATVTYAGDGTATVDLTVGGAAATKLSGNGANSSKYTVQAADWGTELYLVAFGTNNQSGNVTGAAVAGVIQMPYNGYVKINLNGTDLTTAPAPAYGVKLIDRTLTVTDITTDANAISTAWGVGSDATGDEGYYSDAPLDPAKTYDIWVETFPGSTAYVKLGTQLTNTVRTQTANYFTVNFTADVAVDNKVNSVSSALTGPVKNGLSAKVGDKVLTTGTPVLAGQSAAVTMDYDAKNASSEGWDNKQHYTLNWTNAYDGTTKVTTDDVYPSPAADITHTMTVNGTTTNNGGNIISAKLVQKLYDVALTIVDDGTTKTATLASVKIAETGAGAAYTLELDSTTATDTDTGSVVDKFTDGGKITFKVPAGDYEVTAVPGDGTNGTVDTTLVKYVWDSTDSTDKATVAGLPHTPAQSGEIHIIAATYGLEWWSNYDDSKPSEPMSGFAKDEGFTRTGLVYGRYSIPYGSNADSNTYTLQLVNTGNKALNEVKVEGSSTDFTYDLTKATVYQKDGTMVGEKDKANLTAGVTIPAGGYAQFTVQIPKDKDASDADYAVTLSAKAKEWVKADDSQETAAFDAAYQVEPATITALAVTGIETPGTSALDTDHDLSGVKSQATSETGDADDSNATDKYPQKAGAWVTWEPDDTTAKPGMSYTAKVVIAAQSNNYKFDVNNYKKFYTILGKNAADNATLVGATVTTVTVDGETVPALELTYKFSPTAAGTPVITAQGTGGTTAEVTEITSESNVKLDYYYVISKDDIGTYLETDENRKEIINATGTGNKTTIDGHDVFFYGSPNPAKTSGEPEIPTGETVKKAAWTGTDQYGDLTPGTKYHVYAVSVPAGTEKDKVTAEMISPVGSATFTTYYEVKVAVAPAEMGEITTPKTTTNYVKPGEGIVLETTPKDEDVNIFKEWRLDEHGAGVQTAPEATDNSTPITDNATKKIKFWPTANTTITATYEGNPKLKIEGTNPSAEYSENYTTAVNLLEDGKVTNIGTSGMTGDLTLVLMPTTWQPGDSVTDGAYTNFTAQIIKTFNPDDTELSGLVLPKGGYATVAVNPVAGLKLPEGGTKPHYEAILVAYDKGSLDATTGKATVLASTKVAMNLTKDAVINVPSDILWDVYAHASLNHGVANPTDAADGVYNDWNVKVTFSDTSDEVFNANSFTGLKVLEGDWTDTAQEGYENAAATTVEEHKTGTTLANGGWTSSEDSASAVKTKTFTIEKEYIWKLWEDCNKAVGTKYNFFMEVTDSREGGGKTYKHLTLTFIDTTPAVTKVAVSNSNGTTAAHTGETLKATVTTTANTYGSDGTPGTAATATRTDADLAAVTGSTNPKMYINWYRWPLKADGTVDTTATPVLVQGTTVNASGNLSYTTVDANGVPTVAAGLTDANKSTYTLTKADAGYAIQAEALGDIELLGLDAATKGSWIKESENADLTPKLTVTVTKNPADVASITTSPSGVQYVTPGEGLEATVTGVPDGYYFTGWTVDKTDDAANGSFTASGAGTSAGGTETFGGGDKKATKFWPTTDATITANVDLLPTLVYTAGVLSNNGKTATYDIGTGADASNNDVPVLTDGYTQHGAGDGDPVYVLKPAATDGGSFTAAAGATNGYKVIATSDLTEENLKNWLTAGNYTITAYDVDVNANTGKGAYRAVTDDAMTARTGGYEGYDPSVTLVIVNRKQALSVTIVNSADKVEADTSAKELATVNVGITMEAFHVNTATDTAVTTENKVTYQWYVGPAGLDLTKDADLARAKAITVDDANATGKTLEVTAAVADQARKFNASGGVNMENFYVLATAAEDSAYAGKAADDAGVENPKYTVAIRVSQSGDTVTGDSPDHSSMGAVVNPGDATQSSNSTTYTIQVERGKSITLSSKPGAGYQLGAWTMYALPDPATTSVTTGTDPKALGSFGSFSAAPTATSGSGDPVEFFPVGDVLILATFQDYQLLFDDSITESTTPSGTDLPANSAFSRSLTKTYDGQAIGDFKVTLTNPSNTLYNVDVTVTADDYTRASSSIGVTITGFPKTMAKDATEELALDLSKVKDAGTYTLELTAKGNSQADGKGVSVTATYTLTVTIEPKKLDGIKAEVPKPDKEFPKPGDDGVTIQTKDPDGADPTAFGPLPEDVEPKIEWLKPDPENPGEWIKVPDGEKPNPDTPYKPVVTVEPGPNYEFTDDAPTGTPDDDYTINGKDKPTDGADITVVPEYDPDNPTNGPKATLTGDAFPVLTFEDNYKTNQTAKKDFTQTINITVGGTFTWVNPEVTLTANGGTVYQVVVEDVTNAGSNTKIDLTAALETTPEDMAADSTKVYTLKLTDGVTSLIDTSKKGTYVLKLEAKGDSTSPANPADDVTATYTLTINVNEKANPPGPGPSGPSTPDCPPVVIYDIGNKGVTEDSVVEEFTEKQTKPEKVPNVTAIDDYVFRGWTLTDPAKLKPGEKPELVDPKTVKVEEDTTFYAYYTAASDVDHKHYVIGYPNGTFGPADNITRGEVATIIARACLEGFVEGYDYGNPGGYSDVTDHWAYSAISFCSIHGVFKGYEDGTFRPGQPITRQELAVVVARLAGIQDGSEMPFSDTADIGDWAVSGVYTTYLHGWVNGYEDGTFRPLQNIRRDETVKVFNGYLNRGVDKEGLTGLTEYVHSGTASNITGNGTTEYMTWPDVTSEHWAYYEIIEAGNDHNYHWHDGETTPPEIWDQVWIDEVWRYHDDASDTGRDRTNQE